MADHNKKCGIFKGPKSFFGRKAEEKVEKRTTPEELYSRGDTSFIQPMGDAGVIAIPPSPIGSKIIYLGALDKLPEIGEHDCVYFKQSCDTRFDEVIPYVWVENRFQKLTLAISAPVEHPVLNDVVPGAKFWIANYGRDEYGVMGFRINHYTVKEIPKIVNSPRNVGKEAIMLLFEDAVGYSFFDLSYSISDEQSPMVYGLFTTASDALKHADAIASSPDFDNNPNKKHSFHMKGSKGSNWISHKTIHEVSLKDFLGNLPLYAKYAVEDNSILLAKPNYGITIAYDPVKDMFNGTISVSNLKVLTDAEGYSIHRDHHGDWRQIENVINYYVDGKIYFTLAIVKDN